MAELGVRARLTACCTPQRRLPPVRVKVWGADGKLAKVHPPDGEAQNWWQRLNKALGTTSSDFVNASLLQLQAAARSPFGTISETHINAALAMIEAAAPADELEGALAVQMSAAAPMASNATLRAWANFGLRPSHRPPWLLPVPPSCGY